MQPTMLGDGTLTKSLKRSLLHIVLDVVLIAFGVFLMRDGRERRRYALSGHQRVDSLIVAPPSSSFALYETGVETALRAVQLVVMSNLNLDDRELARLRALGATCERFLCAARLTWPGRSHGGEPTAWFTREDFALLGRALATLDQGTISMSAAEIARFALLRDLVHISLSS